ncbi:VOC family protein [Rhodohalobacter sp. SW132]|uniref:VOC family protein n=1 Tax=Rhodohalobacter sp. SW132 TaxID=2293433 RepID=UPI000E26B4A2|nr:VOC family protein [Rhodohalobacter sp. SW132]REL23999.1 VOC family protein [Rhodohalobacter sp. SW132]
MNGHLYFEIHADDLDRAAKFYSTIFRWIVDETGEDLPVEYRRIDAGGTAGGLLKRPADIPPAECGVNAFVCSIEVDDFDQTAENILENGGKTALPKFAVPGVCWQGYFIDTEGNTFGIFQVDESAK